MKKTTEKWTNLWTELKIYAHRYDIIKKKVDLFALFF